MIKKHKWTIIISTAASAISLLVGVFAVQVFAENKIEAHNSKVASEVLLIEAVGEHTKKLTVNDSKWEKQATKDDVQDTRIEQVLGTHMALLESNKRNESATKDLETKVNDGFKEVREFQMEQIKAVGQLTGQINQAVNHMNNISKIKEIP